MIPPFLLEKANKPKDLSEVMIEAGIQDLYGKFQANGVTVDIIWELSDDMLNFLKLNPMEKFRYENARKKYAYNLWNRIRYSSNDCLRYLYYFFFWSIIRFVVYLNWNPCSYFI